MPHPRLRRWAIRSILAAIALVAVGVVVIAVDSRPDTGARPAGDRLRRMSRSPQWQGGVFADTIPRHESSFWTMLSRWVRGGDHTMPDAPIAVSRGAERAFKTLPASGLRITWFGHSSLLVEIDGHRVLVDPVWSERCSPLSFMGPRRFHPPPVSLEDLPPLDVVVISHDHYDHLDYATIRELAARDVPFVVPLGVGAHIEYWNVAPHRIRELDWWESTKVRGLELVATPARHFSGRSLMMTDRDATLWAGWAMIGSRHRVYYSGDTAMFPLFVQIGRRLGPFDATIIEVGAYNALWADVHLGPEQAVIAHQQVRGKVMFPVHWGTFDLALHSWTEPVERTLAAAQRAGVSLVTPAPGEAVEPGAPLPKRWWPRVPWQSAADAPVLSSGLTDADFRIP